MTISRLPLALLAAASFALAGCGNSEKASEGATADTVELPAEDAMAQTSAMPSEVPSDLPTVIATDEGMDTSASAEADD
jgi:hypothetical protein